VRPRITGTPLDAVKRSFQRIDVQPVGNVLKMCAGCFDDLGSALLDTRILGASIIIIFGQGLLKVFRVLFKMSFSVFGYWDPFAPGVPRPRGRVLIVQ
jgi:hypothetical protein